MCDVGEEDGRVWMATGASSSAESWFGIHVLSLDRGGVLVRVLYVRPPLFGCQEIALRIFYLRQDLEIQAHTLTSPGHSSRI